MKAAKNFIDVASRLVTNQAVKKTGASMAKTFAKFPGAQLTEGLSNLHDAHTGLKIVQEQELTKRLEILKSHDVSLESIRSQREVLMKFIDNTFDERKQALQQQFKVLDHALETNNTEHLRIALDAMVTTIKSSPFESVAAMRQQLENKDFVLRLE